MPFAKPTIRVKTTPQSYRVPVNDQGRVAGTNISLFRFCEAFVEKGWNRFIRQFVPVRKYLYHNEKTNHLHLPYYDLPRFIDFVAKEGYEVVTEAVPLSKGVDIVIPMRPEYKDRSELQTRAIDYLVEHPDQVKGLALQTGCLSGKNIVDIIIPNDGNAIHQYRLSDLYAIYNDPLKMTVLGWDLEPPRIVSCEEGQVSPNQILSVLHSGVQMVLRAELENGYHILLTADHNVMTRDGWKPVNECLGKEIQCAYSWHGNNHIGWSVLESLEDVGEEDVFDIECPPDNPSFVCNGVIVHNSGKTYGAIKTISRIGKRAIIMVAGMLEQWERSIYKFTTLKKEDVYIIKGEASIGKLLSQVNRKLKPKIIICSIGTMRNYSQDKDAFSGYPPFDDFCQNVGIGIRITDEAHLNFFANYVIDLRWACNLTVVLTATFGRSQPDVKRIFDRHYPSRIRFGEGEYKKYVNVVEYTYQTGVNDIPWKAFRTADGYSQAELEKYLLEKKNRDKLQQIFDIAYDPIMQSHYFNHHLPGERMLVLCVSVAMCKYFCDYIRKRYQQYKTEIYIGETEDHVLETSDIIISTPTSAGTGRDISNLYALVCTYSTRSVERNLQILGRLRELNGRTPQAAFMANKSVFPQIDHAAIRRELFAPRALTYSQITI